MKRRTWEFLVLLAVVAVLVAVFRKKPELPTREPVSWNLPVIYSPPGEVSGEYGRSRPMYLKPNLERSPEQFSQANIRVDGVGLGMNFDEVLEVLGEPVSLDGSLPLYFSAIFAGKSDYEVTEVSFANGVLVDIFGTRKLQRSGRVVVKSGDALTSLYSHIGKNDYLHGYGSGGSPLYCWAGRDLVLEIATTEKDEVHGFWLGDPTFFTDRPHLWFSGCGGVEDELYIPPNE